MSWDYTYLVGASGINLLKSLSFVRDKWLDPNGLRSRLGLRQYRVCHSLHRCVKSLKVYVSHLCTDHYFDNKLFINTYDQINVLRIKEHTFLWLLSHWHTLIETIRCFVSKCKRSFDSQMRRDDSFAGRSGWGFGLLHLQSNLLWNTKSFSRKNFFSFRK